MPKIITKHSSTPGKVPLAADLSEGELAVNTADGKLYTKHSNNTIVEVTGGSSTGVSEELSLVFAVALGG